MPVSVGRHNLARIRKQLRLTQSDVAKLVGCSPVTIKSVEIGKLALSDSLAERISHSLGFHDADWLLKNDLNAPVPGHFSLPDGQDHKKAPDAQFAVLMELLSRLFAVVDKMGKGQYRNIAEFYIATAADALKKAKEPIPDAQPSHLAGSDSIEFFVQNPNQFDPDLREWVDLKGLLKSNLKLSSQSADDETEEAPSPKRRKSPNQTPAKPSRGGRRKTRASS
jgi:transcriptional regulator with XRE-family HTH domain